MAELHVTEQLHAYLIAQSIGTAPVDEPVGGLTSIWINPQPGPPQPRDGENCTITIRDTAVHAANGVEAWIEESYLDVIVRHRDSEPACRLVHRTIKGLLSPISDHVGRKLWMMGPLLVQMSSVWRDEQPLPFVSEGDVVTYDRIASYRFDCFRSDLST